MKKISLEKFNMLLTIVDILTCNESVKSKKKNALHSMIQKCPIRGKSVSGLSERFIKPTCTCTCRKENMCITSSVYVMTYFYTYSVCTQWNKVPLRSNL